MITADAVDVVLRVQNLRRFQTGMGEAAASVRQVGAAAKQTNAETAAMQRTQAKQAGFVGLARKATVGLGVAAGVAAFEAYKMSVNFQKEMTLVHTQAGASTAEVKQLSGAVLQLAHHSAQGPEELAKGLYHIESLGFRGAVALDALKTASQGAAVGNANLEETASALGSAFFVGIKGAGNLHHTMATLNAIVGAGNMRFDDLNHALGTGILAASKVAGVNLRSVGSAIALLSDDGTNAASGSAQLATALHFLYAPTKKAQDALDMLGISQHDIVTELSKPNGLHDALALLKTRLDSIPDKADRLKVLGSILPGGRGRVLMQLMEQLPKLDQKYHQIGVTTKNFNESLAKTQQTAAYKIKEAWAGLQADLITTGDILRNTLTPVLVFLIDVLGWLVTALGNTITWLRSFNDHWKAIPEPIRIVILVLVAFMAQMALVYGAVRIFMLIRAAVMAVQFAILVLRGAFLALTIGSGPLGWALLAISLILVAMVTHWKWVKNAASNTWNWIKHHWPLLAGILTGPFGILIYLLRHKIGAALEWVYKRVMWVFDKIGGPIKAVAHFLGMDTGPGGHNTLQNATQGTLVNNNPQAHVHTRKGVTRSPAGGLGGGGIGGLPSSSPRGKRVHTPDPVAAAGSVTPIEVHSHLYLDGKEVAASVSKTLADKRARR